MQDFEIINEILLYLTLNPEQLCSRDLSLLYKQCKVYANPLYPSKETNDSIPNASLHRNLPISYHLWFPETSLLH
jgi:hypothetical protein